MKSNTYLETIKIQDGEIFHLEYHQKRYERVLSFLGLQEFSDLSKYISPPLEGLYRCRVVYDEESVEVTYHPYVKRDINNLKIIYDDTIEYTHKSTARDEINALFAKRGRYDDILIVKNSFITDTSIANIALKKDDIWYTPASPLLRGTTRERLLRKGYIVEKDIHLDEVYDYSEVALLNAMIDFDIIAKKNIRELFC